MKKSAIIIALLSVLILSNMTTSSSKKFNPAMRNIGVILGDAVNVRSKSSVHGKIIDKVKKNEFVIIIQWLEHIVQVGKYLDKWVKIKTQRGKIGYIFGAFLFDLNSLFGVYGKLRVWRAYNDVYSYYLVFNRQGEFFINAFAEKRFFLLGKFKILGTKLQLIFKSKYNYSFPARNQILYMKRVRGKNYLSEYNVNLVTSASYSAFTYDK